MEASLGEEGGGSTVAVGSINSSADGSPNGGGRDALPMDDSTLGAFKASFYLSRFLPKKGGTYGGDDMNRLGCRKIL